MMNQMERDKMREAREFTRMEMQNKIQEINREFHLLTDIQSLKNEIRFLNSTSKYVNAYSPMGNYNEPNFSPRSNPSSVAAAAAAAAAGSGKNLENQYNSQIPSLPNI
jgi:hypothetical protein